MSDKSANNARVVIDVRMQELDPQTLIAWVLWLPGVRVGLFYREQPK